MVDPREGFLAREKFPTIAALNEWFEKQPAWLVAESRLLPEHKLLPPVKEEPISPEERARRVAILKGVAAELRKVMNHNCVGRPEQLEWLKPKAEQSEAQRRESERFARMQDHSRKYLLETDLVKTPASKSETAA